MLKSRAERAAVGAAPDEEVVDVCVNVVTPSDLLLNHRSKRRMTREPSPHKKSVSIVHE